MSHYEEPKEVNVGIHAGSTVNANVSFNPIEHLSVIANASYAGEVNNNQISSNNISENDYHFRKYQTEVALGYYYDLKPEIQHATYLGYGMGETANRFNKGQQNEFALNSDLNNIFLQSSLIFNLKSIEGVDVYFSSKVNRINFTEYGFTPNYNVTDNSYAEINLDLKDKIEYVTQFGLGFITTANYLDFVFQLQLNIGDQTVSSDYGVTPFGVYVGLNLKADQLFKSKKTSTSIIKSK